jgi:hypothetical protein
MTTTNEPPSWASLAEEFEHFTARYPLATGQLRLSISYFPIGFDPGDRTTRWLIENGSGASARREFQDLAAWMWRRQSGVDHPNAWLRGLDVLLAEAEEDEVHHCTISGNTYPEPPPKEYVLIEFPDACRVAARIARKANRGHAVWQWPCDEEIAAPVDIAELVDIEHAADGAAAPAASASVRIGAERLATATPDLIFRRTGPGWEMAFAGQRISVADNMRGFEIIRTLLAHPHRTVEAMTLMSAASVPPSTRAIEPVGVESTNGFDGIEAFDERAKHEYLRHVQQLQQDEEEARLRGDLARADACRTEAEAFVDRVSRDVDRHGRARKTGSERERARQAVSKQIERALKRIANVLPDLATHLQDTLRCGRHVVYQPADDRRWWTD